MVERNEGETRAVVLAAVRLFTEAGYDATTMAGIADATGVSRRSLFRRFGSKEDILFAEHDALFTTVVRFMDASPGSPTDTVLSAARLVFQGYVRDPEITMPRYRLVRAHPRLRDREVAMTARYQAAFSHHLAERTGGGRPSLEVEVVASAVIAAHNHVLRGWLRDPEADGVWRRFDEAMERVRSLSGSLSGAPETAPAAGRILVAVYPGDTDPAELGRRVVEAARDRP
ncbi:TetR/AcrR family transcriptional regulator [Nocardiopsis sp. MG754419]|uniref:TetR/AcrR family transcriptional regulator n=1 Tax=Nocardiopsis sp. MG754419 TaxID=2259865 RepID=UPI001BA888CC|nr:TetR/AcrR family transcriptional regulator [Nocardiopsis sp. MG754419]MBR8744341.1 TetR/AcrR family transcriptional regulator [Nocardiopsis sp. MG754419]